MAVFWGDGFEAYSEGCVIIVDNVAGAMVVAEPIEGGLLLYIRGDDGGKIFKTMLMGFDNFYPNHPMCQHALDVMVGIAHQHGYDLERLRHHEVFQAD